MRKALFVIEHLEDEVGKWVLLEYENVARIVGKENLIITNTRNCGELGKIAKCVNKDVTSFLRKHEQDNIVVLDPKADKVLEPWDFIDNKLNIIIIGGILGDHPPKGRTWKLLTTKILEKGFNVKVRNLGKEQLTIDGAAYVAYLIFKGKRLSEIPFQEGLRIVRKIGLIEHEIILPYKYPVLDGKPLVNPKLIEYLVKGIVVDEIRRLEKR
ncbi:MAG: hypothetical protein J7J78_03340 [Thermoprotei archaeon]|nr:hypothetical protein [Thermoprotei archaeon]